MTDLTREKIAETILDGLCDRFPDMDGVKHGDEETWRGIVAEVVGALPASLSVGEPDGMDVAPEEREQWAGETDAALPWMQRAHLLLHDIERQSSEIVRLLIRESARETKAREEEREACAKIVDENAAMLRRAGASMDARVPRDRRDADDYDRMADNMRRVADDSDKLAAAIRARSKP